MEANFTYKFIGHSIHRVVWIFMFFCLFLFTSFRLMAQPSEPIYKEIAKQRLLIQTTAHFLYTVSQGQIDMDSALVITSEAYGLNPFLVYTEGVSNGRVTEVGELLHAGKVDDAKRFLSNKKGADRIQPLLELGSYYVFKPGKKNLDLEIASKYINEVIDLTKGTSSNSEIESYILMAHFLSQSQDMEESQNMLSKAARLSERLGDKKAIAQTLLVSGRLLPYGHSSKLPNLEEALSIFGSINEKEKEIETLSEITLEHFAFKQYEMAEKYLKRTLQLQDEIDFYHNQYPYYGLAYIVYMKGELTASLKYSKKSLETFHSKADSVFISLFYSHYAYIYSISKRYGESIFWYDKALENFENESRLYWYKAFLSKSDILRLNGRSKEAIQMLQTIGGQFPPITDFERMYFALSKANAYFENKDFSLAEENYLEFLKIAKNFPFEYLHGEFPGAFLKISTFYIEIGEIEKAKNALDLINPDHLALDAYGEYYYSKFKIDNLERKYPEAIRNLQLSQEYFDSAYNLEHLKKIEELFVQYETQQKDKDLELLYNKNQLQEAQVMQARRTKNISLGGLALLLIIIGLLFNRYLMKQKSNQKLEANQKELDQKNSFLETLNTEQENLLKEKEWLVREVHHRVKNNLQMVTSLLNSQTAYLNENVAVRAIKDSERRIKAMSLVHQKLYLSENISSIAVKEYIDELVGYVKESFDCENKVIFKQDVEPLDLDVSIAIPIGLIVNEGIVNSLKYAFLNGQTGVVTISLKPDGGNEMLLQISDNGIGLPDGLDVMETNSLGLDLMKGLSKQIKGKFSIESNNGVHVRVRFSVLNET